MHRTLLIVVVTAALFSPRPLEPFWNLLDSLWDASANGDAGCIWDPNGRCLPAPEPHSDAGCIWDPDGLRCSQES